MLGRTTGLLLATMALVAGLAPGVGADEPTDSCTSAVVDLPLDHPYCREVMWALDAGFVRTFGDGAVRPDTVMTRAAGAASLYRFAGSPPFVPPATSPFEDVPVTHPQYLELAWLRANGFLSSTDPVLPDTGLYRALALTWVHRLLGSPTGYPPHGYPDISPTGLYSDAARWSAATSTFDPFGDGGFGPSVMLTRGAWAAVLSRLSGAPDAAPSAPYLNQVFRPSPDTVAVSYSWPVSWGGSDLQTLHVLGQPGDIEVSVPYPGWGEIEMPPTVTSVAIALSNEVGKGPFSAPLEVDVWVESRPELQAITAGRGVIGVQWQGGGGYPGGPVYTARALPGGRSCSTTGSRCTITGLTNGVPYTVVLTIADEQWTSPPSAPLGPRTPNRCNTNPGPYPDVTRSHPFCRSIDYLGSAGIATGFGDGRFRPTEVVTRQSMAVFLHRYVDPVFEAPSTPTFPDVPISHPFFEEIEWLAATGITEGSAQGFEPTAPVTRGSMAAFLFRLTGGARLSSFPSFSDVPVGHLFRTEIQWTAERGITQGYADGTFRPGAVVTRQSMAAFLHRLHVEP